MHVVNLTPHPITLISPDGRQLVLPPSGTVARCAMETTTVSTVATQGISVPLVVQRYGALEGLPEPDAGVLYVASALAAQAAWELGRRDVVCPAELVRDAEGRVIGAAALAGAPALLPHHELAKKIFPELY